MVSIYLKLIFLFFCVDSKNRCCRLLFHLVVLNGTVIHLWILIFQQANHFRTCPKNRSVTMCRIYIDRTVIVKSRVESHSRTDTGSFHLPLRIYLAGYGMPSQMSNRSVSNGVNPSFIDGVCQAVYIYRSSGSFQVRIIPVEQLVPKSFSTLQGCHSTYMSPEIIHHFRTLRIIFR